MAVFICDRDDHSSYICDDERNARDGDCYEIIREASR